ncbi:uncharacterized protein LOC107472569 isoform X1 [Arachis duranensis]|uniref:Uncharacterized protein LOC107472569 isoform X1 n=1 Tax=Arachis duranensis TaxID=130453 RepID=A0A9C6TDT0_ARADU|nr:uncharacterized protein LOC107472569 isoform X1 [Arachis duranensis]
MEEGTVPPIRFRGESPALSREGESCVVGGEPSRSCLCHRTQPRSQALSSLLEVRRQALATGEYCYVAGIHYRRYQGSVERGGAGCCRTLPLLPESAAESSGLVSIFGLRSLFVAVLLTHAEMLRRCPS